MKITITMTVGDEYADPDDDTGLTNEGYELLNDALLAVGYDIDVRAS